MAYKTITVTPTVDTAIYASGDTLFDMKIITSGGAVDGRITAISMLDKSDNTAATFELYFFSASGTFGTINAAPSATDAVMATCIGHVQIPAANFVDVGGSKIATVYGLNIPISSPCYVAATVTGTPTFAAASDVVLMISTEV